MKNGPREVWVKRSAVRLAVREFPGGRPPIVFLHGLASSSRIFDQVIRHLVPDHRCVAFDQRGHGRSSKPDSGFGFDQTAADCAAVIQRLRLGRPVLVGHSWGASVALATAARYPKRISKLVLVDGGMMSLRERMDWKTAKQQLAPPRLDGVQIDEYLGMVRGFYGSVLKWTPEIEAVFRSYVRVDGSGHIRPNLSFRNHLRILRAMWEENTFGLLRKVRAPILIIAAKTKGAKGMEKRFLEAKQEVVPRIRALGLRVEWMEGIHDLPLQKPAALARRIRRFASTMDS
ncbi:MAG: alpha/beta hydrolase [Actinomycetota bacterium]